MKKLNNMCKNCIAFYAGECDGEIYADCMESGTTLFEKVENVTSWTKSQLYAWLGY